MVAVINNSRWALKWHKGKLNGFSRADMVRPKQSSPSTIVSLLFSWQLCVMLAVYGIGCPNGTSAFASLWTHWFDDEWGAFYFLSGSTSWAPKFCCICTLEVAKVEFPTCRKIRLIAVPGSGSWPHLLFFWADQKKEKVIVEEGTWPTVRFLEWGGWDEF